MKLRKEKEYAILTDIIHKEWSDLTVRKRKELKGLDKQNLIDHMTEAELIFTALAELSTREIAEHDNATGMQKKTKLQPKKADELRNTPGKHWKKKQAKRLFRVRIL